MGFDRPGISDSLGADQLAEGIGLTGDLAIIGVLGHELQEPADRGAALVELSCGVQETRSVPDGRGPMGPVAELGSDRGQGRIARRRLGNVRLDRGVAIRDQVGEVRLDGRG